MPVYEVEYRLESVNYSNVLEGPRREGSFYVRGSNEREIKQQAYQELRQAYPTHVWEVARLTVRRMGLGQGPISELFNDD